MIDLQSVLFYSCLVSPNVFLKNVSKILFKKELRFSISQNRNQLQSFFTLVLVLKL